MALDGADLIILQRSGVRYKCRVDELGDKMAGTDLIVVQRGTGTGNLRSCLWDDRGVLLDTDLLMVADADGSNTLKKTTWADVSSFLIPSLVEVTLLAANNGTAANENVTMDDLFSQAILASATTTKRVIIEAGALIGGTVQSEYKDSTPTAALNFNSVHGRDGMQGAFELINNGTILGASGQRGDLTAVNPQTAEARAGGYAIFSELNSTRNTFTITNNGAIYGGGGAGGDGRDGWTHNDCSGSGPQGAGDCVWVFSGLDSCINAYGPGSTCTTTEGECGSFNLQCPSCEGPICVTTLGGEGGDGGRGAGYLNGGLVAAVTGAPGASGTGNAGDGGAGGDGAGLGSAGSDGSSGTTGTGAPGTMQAPSDPNQTSGGHPGYYFARGISALEPTIGGTVAGDYGSLPI